MTLTIVGLGPGDIDDLSRKAWRVLKQATTVYLRTSQHGCVECLPPGYHSFDDVYELHDDFPSVYATIVERVMTAARAGDVVYAVPGDPLVGESTTRRLLAEAKTAGIPVEIVNGISFIEPILPLVGLDAMEGLQILDGLDLATMHHPPINPDYPALLGQVYSRDVASNIKLTLMNQYPDSFEVMLIHAAGTPDALIEKRPLYEIDHSPHISHMTALYIPVLGAMSSFERFQEIIAHLRAPEGCPWDRKQTHESLRRYLIEEAYEVLEAIDNDDSQALAEELGDLLLQIVLHTQIAIDDGEFHMSDVLRYINTKMIRRHPHVWGDVNVADSDQVVTNWDALKKQEHAEQGKTRVSVLDGVPKGLPALLQALEYQSKAAKIGFDWNNVQSVLAILHEEIDEVLTAPTDEDRAKELGDVLFSVVNWARWLKIEPETALRATSAKFYRRFRYIESTLAEQGRDVNTAPMDELEALWQAAKSHEL